MLELDHVFCMVSDPDQAVRRLQDDGWVLDAGQAHRGQGTRNRRLLWPQQYFELLWLTDAGEARTNPLRLDRRADSPTTGASPVGLGFRGQIEPGDSDQFWLYVELGPRIWIHRDNERCPERPLIFVLEADEQQMHQRRQQRISMSEAVVHRHSGELREVQLRGPSAPSAPSFAGPPVLYEPGRHSLELVAGSAGLALSVSDGLVIRA